MCGHTRGQAVTERRPQRGKRRQKKLLGSRTHLPQVVTASVGNPFASTREAHGDGKSGQAGVARVRSGTETGGIEKGPIRTDGPLLVAGVGFEPTTFGL